MEEAPPINRVNGSKAPNPPKDTGPVFDAEAILLQQRTRFNPLRTLDPLTLAIKLDAFEAGLLRDAALLWDAMAKRDDTIPAIKFLREETCSSQDWQVLKIEGAPEPEASRHAAALRWFYDNLTAVNAFDRNERGGFAKCIDFLMSAASYRYAVLHIRWRPQPGVTVPVDADGADDVPALTAEVELVPLWFFENTTGQLRFLPNGGFGINGDPLDWESGEWMCAAGPGVMFAGSIAYMFKRLTFQDWTIYNERYAQGKVLVQTKENKESDGGRGAKSIAEAFNADAGFVLYGQDGTIKDPVSILEPKGNSAETFKEFVDRQDRKMTVLFLGEDLSTMSRGGRGEKPVGASVQHEQGDKIKQADVRMCENALQYYLDRQVIRFVFGEGVTPLAYRGVPAANAEDADTLRASAGFLADRGVKVSAVKVADRLGVTVASDDEEALGTVAQGSPDDDSANQPLPPATANAAAEADDDNLGAFLAQARMELDGGIGQDFRPLAEALLHVLDQTDADLDDAYAAVTMRFPSMVPAILAAKRTKEAYAPILATGIVNGLASLGRTVNDSLAGQANFTRPVRARSAAGSFKPKAKVHLRTGKSTATEAEHLQPGDRVWIDERPVNLTSVRTSKGPAHHVVHLHGKDDLGQVVHHRFFGKGEK